jgi:hypothetical protein
MGWRAPRTIRVTRPEGDTEVMRRDNKIKYLALQLTGSGFSLLYTGGYVAKNGVTK